MVRKALDLMEIGSREATQGESQGESDFTHMCNERQSERTTKNATPQTLIRVSTRHKSAKNIYLVINFFPFKIVIVVYLRLRECLYWSFSY